MFLSNPPQRLCIIVARIVREPLQSSIYVPLYEARRIDVKGLKR
jgi:hypothetical protein